MDSEVETYIFSIGKTRGFLLDLLLLFFLLKNRVKSTVAVCFSFSSYFGDSSSKLARLRFTEVRLKAGKS